MSVVFYDLTTLYFEASDEDDLRKTGFSNDQTATIRQADGARLIVSMRGKRAIKDKYNREKGLARFQKRIQSGKLTKSVINNRGYKGYLKHTKSEITVKRAQEIPKTSDYSGVSGILFIFAVKIIKRFARKCDFS